MNRWFLFLLVVLLLSCKDFELKKQSADQILEEQLKSINWNEVDFYPRFNNCGTINSKDESKICFDSEIKKAISKHLEGQKIASSNTSNDTLLLKLFVTKEGVLSLEKLIIPEKIELENPKLRSLLNESIETLPKLSPAQKRSVPVPLHTQLPIIINK